MSNTNHYCHLYTTQSIDPPQVTLVVARDTEQLGPPSQQVSIYDIIQLVLVLKLSIAFLNHAC